MAIPGFRVQQLAVVTTLTDAQQYPKEEVARLFCLRWHVELDLRTICAISKAKRGRRLKGVEG
jgi:hypothetical protein